MNWFKRLFTRKKLGNNKYNVKIVGLDGVATIVDAYRVCTAFKVISPQLQHLIKKALKPGSRGHKNERQDLVDIRDSADSAILEYDQTH